MSILKLLLLVKILPNNLEGTKLATPADFAGVLNRSAFVVLRTELVPLTPLPEIVDCERGEMFWYV